MSFILLWTCTHGHDNLALLLWLSGKSRSLSQYFDLLRGEELFYRTAMVSAPSLLTFPVVTFFTCVE